MKIFIRVDFNEIETFGKEHGEYINTDGIFANGSQYRWKSNVFNVVEVLEKAEY
ncbi:hypothetical protein [Tenacibaculum litopenaei]|uniref:hypothetical protein n=1 Tax=Tenacibaculum litopenaei TaxID=396016 RepID=UPI0038B48BF1